MVQALRRRRKGLRKQPRIRRVRATGVATLPGIIVPPEAKKRKKRNRKSFRLALVALWHFVVSTRLISFSLLAICFWALAVIGRDESFFLTYIPVEGTISISPSEVVSASKLAGVHIFAADPNESATEIGHLPGVISSTVMLAWPNQVAISIGEESPIAVWQQAGDQYWITQDGNLLPSRLETTGLLHIDSEITEPVDGQDFVPSDVLAGALQLRELRPNIDRLYYRPGAGLSYQDGRGWRAFFGSGLEMEQKLAVYETIVEYLSERQVQPVYISVSNHQKPYYMAGN